MAIINTRLLGAAAAVIVALFAACPLLKADDLQTASILKIERPFANTATTNSNLQPTLNRQVVLDAGKTTVIMSLSSTEAISGVSFANNGAKGRVTIFASPIGLPSGSKRWQRVASDNLAEGVVKSVVRLNEARYLKVTFDITQPGEISRLGVYTAATVASKGRGKDYALLATDSGNAIETDGKTVADGKDLGEGKDIPSEGEAPAEGPPPGLPAPPPFTFVPVLVPTSP